MSAAQVRWLTNPCRPTGRTITACQHDVTAPGTWPGGQQRRQPRLPARGPGSPVRPATDPGNLKAGLLVSAGRVAQAAAESLPA